ncbi:MAG: DNA-binding protein [Verrucomicrobium sp.]|nr:DNA-binding protein [Verrucomicrobium sp.]
MDASARTLKNGKIEVERKTFLFDLKENDRGRFLRITEDVRGRRDTIIIPAPGLEDFRRAIELMITASNEAGPAPGRPPEFHPQEQQ